MRAMKKLIYQLDVIKGMRRVKSAWQKFYFLTLKPQGAQLARLAELCRLCAPSLRKELQNLCNFSRLGLYNNFQLSEHQNKCLNI